jgi:L-aspartate oxidase
MNAGAEQADRIVVVGAGLAGLALALRLAPRPVTILTKSPVGVGAASVWAQGGIAAAIGRDDAPALHEADTLAAAAGIADREIVRKLTEAAPEAIDWLAGLGVPFDRDADGGLQLGREAAHGRKRIVHVAGDATGAEIMRVLAARVAETPSVEVVLGEAASLAQDGEQVVGVWYRPHGAAPSDPLVLLPAAATVIATGGIGRLYRETTNPQGACGQGLALAAWAGARLADLEFVQFHPTAIDVGRDPMPLATEALRGAGAVLVNGRGERFMVPVHPDAELAPRDVVARAIFRERQAGRAVFLDATRAIGDAFDTRFPTVAALCREAGIDPSRQPIPVAPAVHYHMGGVAVDARGRTSVPGLWAAGEVACTGAHGANRLASNSLLEALWLAREVAADVAGISARADAQPARPMVRSAPVDAALEAELRRIMSENVGVARDADRLRQAVARLDALAPLAASSQTLAGMVMIGRLMALSALARTESRGSHFREDFPLASDAWKRRVAATRVEIEATADELTRPSRARARA